MGYLVLFILAPLYVGLAIAAYGYAKVDNLSDKLVVLGPWWVLQEEMYSEF